MHIAFIGYGNVGPSLADQVRRLGLRVTLAARDPGTDAVRKARSRNAALHVASLDQAVREADVVFLATPYASNAVAMPPPADAQAGKLLVDCTNPVGPVSRMHGAARSRARRPCWPWRRRLAR